VAFVVLIDAGTVSAGARFCTDKVKVGNTSSFKLGLKVGSPASLDSELAHVNIKRQRRRTYRDNGSAKGHDLDSALRTDLAGDGKEPKGEAGELDHVVYG
jgi:hypothetical protein